jgi:putative flippase GtrA
MRFKQFFLYCLCGGTGVMSHFLVFHASLGLFANSSLGYQIANTLGYLVGTLLSFVLNRVITFGVRDRAGKRLGLFVLVAACGYGVSSGLLWVLVEWAKLTPRWALVLSLPMVVVLQFGLNRKITFRTSASAGIQT